PRCDLDVVLVALVVEPYVERDDAEVRVPLGRLGEIGRGVEDDRGVLGGQLHAAAASRTVAMRGPSSPSFVMHATAPAARTSSTSCGVTEAVRQTTRVDGEAARTARVASAPFSPGIR